jgi:hypothetical protein
MIVSHSRWDEIECLQRDFCVAFKGLLMRLVIALLHYAISQQTEGVQSQQTRIQVKHQTVHQKKNNFWNVIIHSSETGEGSMCSKCWTFFTEQIRRMRKKLFISLWIMEKYLHNETSFKQLKISKFVRKK